MDRDAAIEAGAKALSRGEIHEARCEREWESVAMAWTPCGCWDRAAAAVIDAATPHLPHARTHPGPAMSDNERARAAALGQAGWGQHASTQQRRYAAEASDRRRKCHCGCGGRATHVGMANGLALMSGCHWHVRLWVKDPSTSLRRRP